MREESKSAVVKLPAEVVWDYLSDYDRVVRLGWAEASARRIRPTLRCKVRYEASANWEDIDTTYTACLAVAERPRTLTWFTRDGAAKSWVRFDLEAVDASATRVLVTLHFETVWMFRTFEEYAWESLRPAFHQTMARLERLHEVIVPVARGE